MTRLCEKVPFAIVLALVARAAAAEDAAFPEEKVPGEGIVLAASGSGSARLGLVLQIGFDILPNQVEGARNGFSLERARLSLAGHVGSENLTYLFSGDAVSGFGLAVRPGAPGSEVLPEEGGDEVPFLLDAKVRWRIPAVGLAFSLGRFIPTFGLSMPEKVSRLGAINYPLYIHGGKGSLGTFRSVGLEAELELTEWLQAGGGIFNGGKNTWLDDNDRKDLLAYLTLTPLPGLAVRASALFQFPEVQDGVAKDGDPLTSGHETHIVPILEARYRDFGFDVQAGGVVAFATRDDDDTREDYKAYGFLAHLGYVVVGDWLELFVRGEYLEPDDGTPADDEWRITAGPQILVHGIHAQVAVNYVQDIFAGERAMCESYLHLADCSAPEEIPEVTLNASTILMQFTLDL